MTDVLSNVNIAVRDGQQKHVELFGRGECQKHGQDIVNALWDMSD